MNPTASSVHVDVALSNFSIAYQPQEFVLDEILPLVPSDKTGKYWQHGKEKFHNPSTRRGQDGSYNRIQHSYANTAYSCDEFGLEEPVDDSVEQNADAGISPQQDAAAIVTEIIKLDLELRGKTEIITTNPPTTANALAGADRWDDPASDPVQQVESDRQTIIGLGGIKPNRLFIAGSVYSALVNNTSIKDRIKYGGMPTSGGIVTKDALKALFQVDEIIVGNSVYNTANEGATEVLAYVWPKAVLLYYYPGPNPGLKTTAYGIQPNWRKDTGSMVMAAERYRDEVRRSEIVRVRTWRDFLITGKDFAALRTTVIS